MIKNETVRVFDEEEVKPGYIVSYFLKDKVSKEISALVYKVDREKLQLTHNDGVIETINIKQVTDGEISFIAWKSTL